MSTSATRAGQWKPDTFPLSWRPSTLAVCHSRCLTPEPHEAPEHYHQWGSSPPLTPAACRLPRRSWKYSTSLNPNYAFLTTFTAQVMACIRPAQPAGSHRHAPRSHPARRPLLGPTPLQPAGGATIKSRPYDASPAPIPEKVKKRLCDGSVEISHGNDAVRSERGYSATKYDASPAIHPKSLRRQFEQKHDGKKCVTRTFHPSRGVGLQNHHRFTGHIHRCHRSYAMTSMRSR